MHSSQPRRHDCSMSTNWTAIVLTGGRSRRFGSDKSEAVISGHSLLDAILLALPAELRVIVVGSEPGTHVRPIEVTREEPINSGPVAGIAAGLVLVETDLVGVIATDMPFAVPLLSQLVGQLPAYTDAVMPIDSAGFRQPLCAVYRVAPLRHALGQLGGVHGQSMRNLATLLNVHEVFIGVDAQKELMDIDTPADLQRAVAILGATGKDANDEGW